MLQVVVPFSLDSTDDVLPELVELVTDDEVLELTELLVFDELLGLRDLSEMTALEPPGVVALTVPEGDVMLAVPAYARR